MRLGYTGKPHMPLFNVLIMVFCSWLSLLAVTGVIEHVRLRRDENERRAKRAMAIS
jgi:putative effector of murein hydrolase LrgA (UPF0299 family)